MEIPTMTVLYEDGREVRINVADFDAAKHRMPGEAAPESLSLDASNSESHAPATPSRKSRK